jgi:hypothetical protein
MRPVRSDFAGLGVTIDPSAWWETDLNDDRLADLQQIVSQESAGKYILWLLQLRSRGDGTWEFRRVRAVRSYPTADTRAWRPADVNGDGKTDFVHGRSYDGVFGITTLVNTPGQTPMRKEWTPKTTNRYPAGTFRLRTFHTGEEHQVLEAITGLMPSSSILGSPTGWRIDTFYPTVAPDRVTKLTDALGGELRIWRFQLASPRPPV